MTGPAASQQGRALALRPRVPTGLPFCEPELNRLATLDFRTPPLMVKSSNPMCRTTMFLTTMFLTAMLNDIIQKLQASRQFQIRVYLDELFMVAPVSIPYACL